MEGKLKEEEGKILVRFAKRAIEHYLKNGTRLEIKPSEVPSANLVRDGACFVSIYIGKDKALRGCIGSLEACRPLVLDVVDNALNAAFGDPRFHPLRPQELKDVRIEVSVLTPNRKLEVKSPDELLKKLEPRRDGVTIKKGWVRATFLPVVWEQIPDKAEFLCHLCVKAGLSPEEWKNTEGMEFFVYEAQEFVE
jgi:AmmeMemoRadiSam system protein A